MNHCETYISVDIETAGPNPGAYSLLSIGACLVADPTHAFYVEVQPVNNNALPHALQVSGLTLAYLAEHGLPPAEVMSQFEAWVLRETPSGHTPVFVAFNAPSTDVRLRILLPLPGTQSIWTQCVDIQALYMGLTGVRWHGRQ